MYELAQLPPGATLSVRDLCEIAEVPDNFGASLVPFLVDAGLVETTGFRGQLLALSRPATQITMAEIVVTCEPDFSLAQCTRDPLSCGRSSHCGVHMMWAGLDQVVMSHLGGLTLAHVARGQGVSCALRTPADSERALARLLIGS